MDGQRRGDRGDVCSLDVFRGDKFQTGFPGGLSIRFLAWICFRFPYIVGDTIADLAEQFNQVGSEGGDVEREGSHFGDVGS